MKRFLIIGLLVLGIGIGAYFVIYETSWYLPFLRQSPAQAAYRSNGRALEEMTDDGYEDLSLKAVNISSFVPGHLFSEYAPSREEYLTWMEGIFQVGANTLCVSNLMDDDFYNALYDFNASHEEKLYLIQGIGIPDEITFSSQTAFSGILEELIRMGKLTIDAVHGRRNAHVGSVSGFGSFRKDVSPYIVSYMIMLEDAPDTIAFTDQSVLHRSGYQGNYYSASQEASLFETMLCQVMDETMAFEADKYRRMRPIGISLDPATDFLVYQDVYARQLKKYASIDPEHIVPSAGNQAGMTAGYRLDNVRNDFYRYLDETSKEKLRPCFDSIGISLYEASNQETDSPSSAESYEGWNYLALLREYHTMPLFGFFGASSGKGPLVIGENPMTEEEQGQALVQVSRILEELSYSAQIVCDWQDVWSMRTWNTAFMTQTSEAYQWYDIVTETKNRGLVKFVPNKILRADGSKEEWEEVSPLISSEKTDSAAIDQGAGPGQSSLFVQSNEEGVFLLIEGIDPSENAYIPLDVLPDAGAMRSSSGLSFERGAEYIVSIENGEVTLLVQERYDAAREGFLFEMEGVDPFTEIPAADTDVFVPVYLALENKTLVDRVVPQTKPLTYLGRYEIGKLSDAAGSQNGQGDFCYGDGFLEIRLPWVLIGFGDPSSRAVHKDYYQYYGIEDKAVRSIYVGLCIGQKAETVTFSPYKLKGWTQPKTSMVFKDSYYILQEYWKGGK